MWNDHDILLTEGVRQAQSCSWPGDLIALKLRDFEVEQPSLAEQKDLLRIRRSDNWQEQQSLLWYR